jgi:hypothetical protein
LFYLSQKVSISIFIFSVVLAAKKSTSSYVDILENKFTLLFHTSPYRVRLTMKEIPAAVEATMLDAGFSPTEILILRRLLEDDALTLREIAARSGKSTGVLDQGENLF